MEEQNDFMKMRKDVDYIVSKYMNLRKQINWEDKGKSATIQRLAAPFLKGYFTIAVAGKMSSGKSTFINSLIGENMLPTGHFQTTSGITWIISSDKRKMEVTFANGKSETYTDGIAERLKTLAAVPEEFDALPINDINTLIEGGDDITTILKKKPGIEEKTGTSSDSSLWKKYVASMPKSKIATEIKIYLPLPYEYKGWRIVDTPGVGAIGGIQDVTKKLLTKKEGEDNANAVDAVVLLHSGIENIQDENANRFAEDVRDSLGNLARGRLFFVLTHAGDDSFLINKEGILQRANNLFGLRLGIPSERITYVDSLMHRFLTDAKRSKRDFSNRSALSEPLNGWTINEWKAVRGIMSDIRDRLEFDYKKEVNNNSLFAELEEISRFESLRKMLYDFLNDEKAKAFDDIFTMIENELQTHSQQIKEEINAVSNGKEAINEAINKATEEKTALNITLSKVRQKAGKDSVERQFNYIEVELEKLSQLPSIGDVRTRYLEIINEGLDTEKKFFKALVDEFSSHASQFERASVTFKSLDFDDLEKQATEKATTQVTDYSRSKKVLVKSGGWCSSDEYKTTYPYTKDKVDFEQKKREFVVFVKREGRKHYDAFKRGITAKAVEFLDIVSKSINEKTTASINRLEGYKRNLENKNQTIANLNSKLNSVNNLLAELNKFEA